MTHLRATLLGSSSSILSVVAAMSLVGCGGAGGGFGATFPDNRAGDLGDVVARERPLAETPRVLFATTTPRGVVVFDLASGQRSMEAAGELRSMPHLAGNYAVVHEPDGVVVRSATSGAVTARIADRALSLVGADGEGESGVLVLSSGGGVGASSRIAILQGGGVAREVELDQAAGAPAFGSGMAFIPWAHQNLSVVDALSGAELARVRSHGDVVTTALSGYAAGARTRMFFAGNQLAVVDPAFAADATFTAAPEGTRPGNPPLAYDAYTPPPSANSAVHRVRLAYAPEVREGRAGYVADQVHLIFYRLVFALDARSGAVRWVVQVPRDVVGATVTPRALYVADETGTLRALELSTGRELGSHAFGVAASYAEIVPGDYLPSGGGAAPGPLRDQLLAAAESTDGRLVPAREYAVRELARLDDPAVTENLIAICENRTVTPSVKRAACDALGARTTGAEYVTAALERHAAFLRGTQAPPVGALARAAVSAHVTGALPLLVSHLRDPETPAADLVALVQAIVALGNEGTAEALADFLRLYHAEAPDSGMGEGLVAAVHGYRRLAGPTSTELLEALRDDPMSWVVVRGAAGDALEGRSPRGENDAAPAAQPEGDSLDAPTTSGGSDMTFTEDDDPRPRELTTALVATTLDPVARDLERCLVQSSRVFDQARVVLAVEPSGILQMITVTPTELQSCIEPLVRSVPFPQTRARGRQRVTHQVLHR